MNEIPQRYKDIVFGFVKQSQTVFPDNNPYFHIVLLIQHYILLYFYPAIPSIILTDIEKSEFINLLQANDKSIINQNWNLCFRFSRDIKDVSTSKEREIFIDKVHEKQDIVVFVETKCGNVFGGYTKQGWKKIMRNDDGNYRRVYTNDKDAFVFSIRSNKGWDMKISNVKQDQCDRALSHAVGTYLNFGSRWIFYQNCGKLRHQNPDNYESFPRDHYLLGGQTISEVTEIEAFQLD